MTAPRMTAWLLLYPGVGSAGWTGHWLDFDLVVQGLTLDHAHQVALESAAYFLARRPPGQGEPRYRPAPPTDWERLDRVTDGGGVVGDLASLPTEGAGDHVPVIEAVAANYSIDLSASPGAVDVREPGLADEIGRVAVTPFRPVVVFVLQGRRTASPSVV